MAGEVRTMLHAERAGHKMTNQEKKALLMRLMAAAGKSGWTGGADASKTVEFVHWAEDENVEFTEKNGTAIDIKALMVDQPDEKTVIVTQADDMADDTNEMEEDDEDEKPKSGQGMANRIKRLEASIEQLRRAPAPRAAAPAVEAHTGEEIMFMDRCKKGRTVFRSLDSLRGFGHVLRNVGYKCIGEHERAHNEKKSLLEHMDRCGLDAKAYATTPLASGGALVPESYLADIINNVEEYGIARKLCRVIAMTSSKVTMPRRKGTHKVYYPEEGGTMTDESMAWDNVILSAKMGTIMTRASRQILMDSAIDLVDDTAREIARAIALIEDNSLFFGDGSTGPANDYMPGVIGIATQFGATATSDLRSVTGGGTAAAHTGAHLASFIGKVPSYARVSPVIVTSPELHSDIFDRLAITDIGGMAQVDYEAGMIGRYRGIPIMGTPVFPSVGDAGGARIDALAGDFSRAVRLGDHMSLEIATSEDRFFDTNQLAIRGLVRHDINVHDLGSATEKSPVVALYQN